jgi:hypothetical protein
VEINLLFSYGEGLQLDLVGNRWELSTPFLGFARFEKVGKLFNGENTLLGILPDVSGRDPME